MADDVVDLRRVVGIDREMNDIPVVHAELTIHSSPVRVELL